MTSQDRFVAASHQRSALERRRCRSPRASAARGSRSRSGPYRRARRPRRRGSWRSPVSKAASATAVPYRAILMRRPRATIPVVAHHAPSRRHAVREWRPVFL